MVGLVPGDHLAPTPFSCSPSSLQPTVLGHHCCPPTAVPGPDLRSQHRLRHQRGELGPPPPPLTWRPAVPAVDTGFPSFSHISMGLGAPAASQVSRTGLWSSTGPGRLGGSVMRGGTAGRGRHGARVDPAEGEAGRAPGRAPPQECMATDESSGTATPNTGRARPGSRGCLFHPSGPTDGKLRLREGQWPAQG